MSWELCRQPRTTGILRVFVKPELSGRLFKRLSFDTGERATLARLGRLILLAGPIYKHLHAARWSQLDGCCVDSDFPFDMATSLEAAWIAQPTY